MSYIEDRIKHLQAEGDPREYMLVMEKQNGVWVLKKIVRLQQNLIYQVFTPK